MCRMRISTWSRTATNSNTLVNVERWEWIKKTFPDEVKDRMEGKSAEKYAKLIESEKNSKPARVMSVSEPGEIRKEYEAVLQRENDRLKAEKLEEEQQSLQYIQQVIATEERLTVNDYITRINSNNTPSRINPQPANRTAALLNQMMNSRPFTPTITVPTNNNTTDANTLPLIDPGQLHETPIILDSQSESTVHVPVIRRSNSRLQRSQLVDQCIDHQREAEATSSTTSTPPVQSTTNPETSFRRTRSMKRNIEEVKNIRTHLLSSITEAKLIKKSIHPTNIITSLSNDDVDISIDVSVDVRDDTPVREPAPLKRRGSLRLKAKQEANNDSLHDATKTPLQPKRSRQTNL